MIENDLIAARVIARERVACDVISLRLVSDAPDFALPAFDAGAHIDLHLRDGLTRKYSLCNDPFERGVYEIAIKREPASRGGSAHVHDAIRGGDVLRIGAPLNYFPLAPDDSPAVLLAAGIGVTPLLAMAHSLLRAGRPLAFHYFVRSADAAAYGATLASQLADVATAHTGLTPDATGDAVAAIVGAMDPRARICISAGRRRSWRPSMRSRARRSATRGSITSIFPRRSRVLPRVSPAGSRSSSRARGARCACRRSSRSPMCCTTTASRSPRRARRACAAHAGRPCSTARPIIGTRS